MQLKNLADQAVLALPDDLLWSDEHAWTPVVASVSYLLTGALLVESATGLARHFGVSELVIGVTMVALGTSLPELATTVVAAARREGGIAVGNVVGSNLFNTLAVAGPAAALAPVGDTTALFGRHLPGLLGITALLGLVLVGRRTVDRRRGALLLVAYAVLLLWWIRIWP